MVVAVVVDFLVAVDPKNSVRDWNETNEETVKFHLYGGHQNAGFIHSTYQKYAIGKSLSFASFHVFLIAFVKSRPVTAIQGAFN